ncbi:hypothetical protein [Comamonas thiooxydans]|uniref:hypothetical protein n=1 Tax=Comamonas thiooxydans TaxID=363952 RepID=UPI0010408076|nr:hypothetical protein [Comamonas thiooxydans]
MKNEQLAEVTTNARGFPKVRFADKDGVLSNITCSSVVGDYEDSLDRPGTSALMIGIDQVEPLILAKEAKAHGVSTQEEVGWVPYPVPKAVLMNASLHLNREQVRGQISRLEHWLEHGNF